MKLFCIVILVLILSHNAIGGDYFPVKRPTPDVNFNFNYANYDNSTSLSIGFDLRHCLKILNPPVSGHYEISSNLSYNFPMELLYYSIILGRGCCLGMFTFRLGPLIGTNFDEFVYGSTLDVQIPTLFGSKNFPQYLNLGTIFSSIKEVNEFHIGLTYKFGFKSYQMD